MAFDINAWKAMRQRARTDLFFLCNSVLGYKDVKHPTHTPLVAHLQRFQGGTDNKCEQLSDGRILIQRDGYEPSCSLWELKGKRKKLSLVTRGALKTTVLTQAHSIQWIINYPDIRILLISAQLPRAKDFLYIIKQHFIRNETFRFLFPEFCPRLTKSGKTEDFGDTEQFKVPPRNAFIKEPTVRTGSADSSVAGGHYEVTKIDDLVEDQNTRTPGGIEQTKKFFGALWPLVETSEIAPGHGWMDLTGTIYHFADLHCSTYLAELKKPVEERQWSILYRSAAPNYPEGPFFWQSRIGPDYLKGIENDPALGPAVLYPQYLLKPLQDKDGLITCKEDIRWISRKHLDNLSPRISWNVTIDLAGMKPGVIRDNDYESINLHGWGTDGRCYFDRIWWGRFTPQQVIDMMFECFKIQPRIQFFKIEQEAHEEVLAPFLLQEMDKRGIYLPVMKLQRLPGQNNVARIRGTQPYWHNGCFVFCDDIAPQAKNQLELEALYFPKFNHDDILSTCADALHSRDGLALDSRVPEKPPQKPDDDNAAEKTWKGIPAEHLSAAALRMIEEEPETNFIDPMTGW